jgi:prepilin-type N-terminal cleavage/methylation domain-containing protein
MFKFLNKKIKQNSNRGFTLVEMAVVAGIFGIITAVVVYKYGDFTSNLLVSNMAYEIALTTRQAQVFGVGVRGFEIEGERDFNYPYGVFFNLNDGSSAEEMQSRNFILFVDRNDDLRCGSGALGGDADTCTCAPGDECLDQYSMQRNIRLTEIKVGVNNCFVDVVTSVAVSFKRPNPEARIKNQGNGNDGFSFVQLKVEAPGSGINPSYVLIRNNGQISVSSETTCSGQTNWNV